MNKILVGVNAILIAAVAFLFFKVNSINTSTENQADAKDESAVETKKEEAKPVEQIGNTPTGKIAYINIDKLNEESLEIEALVAETKKRKSSIEASVESLSMQYQKKMEEYQISAKAGIASQGEMQAKEKEILGLEKEAQNKQLQMDNLSMDINQKNANFQQNVRDFLIKWNKGRYDYILSYSDVSPTMLLGNTTLEITDEVIKELNSDYKQQKKSK